jgi:16S rRNA (uracil1498-N3)-methyltransferase
MGKPDGSRGNCAMKAPPWLLAESGTLETGRVVVLDPSEARHLSGPLRRRPGEEIVLADGRGTIAAARLVEVGRKRVEAEVLSVRHKPEPLSGGATVALSLLGSQAMDWAVQKAVEIGMRQFVPIETERSQLRAKDLGQRLEHWRRISRQALKQCHRPWAMTVENVECLEAFVEGSEEPGVVADRDGCWLDELPSDVGGSLIVGPEGGLTDAESKMLGNRGWLRLRLGEHILRAETAVVVGGAMMVARSVSTLKR